MSTILVLVGLLGFHYELIVLSADFINYVKFLTQQELQHTHLNIYHMEVYESVSTWKKEKYVLVNRAL